MSDLDSDNESARFVVIGGGTGIIPCLQGLNRDDRDVTAIVTVADDGGSSGRLRKDYHILPPGDIRNCVVAMASSDPLIIDLFNYRFEDSILKGHSFGNLFLAVLTRLTGDFRQAIEEARRILGVRNRVLPSTETRVVLVAEHPDGTKSTGEQVISRCTKPINRMALRPQPDEITQEVRDSIAAADIVVLGPGSLYTSIIPNLLVPGMAEAIATNGGKVVHVGNLMTQPGETDGFDLADHVKSLREVGGLEKLDYVVYSDTDVPESVLERYREAGAEPIRCADGDKGLGDTQLISEDVSRLTSDGLLRHDGEKLARLLYHLATDERNDGND